MNKYINVDRIEFVVTNNCSGKCKHCSVELSANKDSVNPEVAVSIINELCKKYTINSIMTFGGEPLLFPDTVCQIHKSAYLNNVGNRDLITNGYFSKNFDIIGKTAKKLFESNITKILLSVDSFHQESIPIEPVMYFAKSLLKYGFTGLKTHPAWVVNKDHDNIYNRKTKKLLNTFMEIGVEPSNGNNIFPKGNAIKYLQEYFVKPGMNELFLPCGSMPYTGSLDEITTISIRPDGVVQECSFLLGNVYEKSILEIIEEYNPYNDIYSKTIIEGGVKELYKLALEKGIDIDLNNCYTPCMVCEKIMNKIKALEKSKTST
jgi:MoaA/NifB/PqqE/SkfB family radical SAM enzyme